MAMLEVKRQMGRGDIAAVSELLDVATAVDGHRPLGEHQWLDLVHGGRAGFAGLVAWEPGHGHPVGYAQITREETPLNQDPPNETLQNETGRLDETGHGCTWALEYVVDPHHRDKGAGPGIGQTLVEAALDVVRAEGGGHVHLWVPKPTDEHDRVAAAAGLSRGRELRQLRRPLPLDASALGEWPGLDVRPFVPGQDEAAWLEVNNRAFRWHPEQGGWDLETLRHRQAQAWFDPAGFLLHERDGKLAGFCWTKVHHDHSADLGGIALGRIDLGEIYVVAVDPSFQRLGLGRSLVLAGLVWLAERGLETAMLYVDADNAPALRLYDSLGFTVDHVDRAYVGDVSPAHQPR